MSRRDKRKKWWNSTRDVSVTLLEVVRDSADALPPLKSAAGFLTSSHKVAERIASIPQITEHLQLRLAIIDDKIKTLLPPAADLDEDLAKRLIDYDLGLVEIAQELETLRIQKQLVTQFIHLRRTESKLNSVSSKLDQAELDLQDLRALYSQRRLNVIHNDLGLVNQTLRELHKKEENLHKLVSSTKKIIVFFQSGPARGLF